MEHRYSEPLIQRSLGVLQNEMGGGKLSKSLKGLEKKKKKLSLFKDIKVYKENSKGF